MKLKPIECAVLDKLYFGTQGFGNCMELFLPVGLLLQYSSFFFKKQTVRILVGTNMHKQVFQSAFCIMLSGHQLLDFLFLSLFFPLYFRLSNPSMITPPHLKTSSSF
jgi:hypothetical protein